ncbi:MAG: hypothetical protein WBP45_14830 [Daejeonella sp.]
MHKYTFEQSEVIKKNKKYIPKTIYDVYGYQLGESREKDRYKFTTINRDNYCMRDSNFVRKNAKQFKSVKDIKGFFYDSTDYKRFPFKCVFIVEYIDVNRYKVVQVNTYIGSDQ